MEFEDSNTSFLKDDISSIRREHVDEAYKNVEAVYKDIEKGELHKPNKCI